MRKTLGLVLVLCVCISLNTFAFMITSLNYYDDKEAGYVYFFGKFSEVPKNLKDIGFNIGDKYFSLNKKDANNSLKTGFEVACENGNVFGIGIKNTDKVFGSEFVVTPYIETDKGIELNSEAISYTKYNKNPEIVSAYLVSKLKPGYYDPKSSSFGEISDNKHRLTTSKDTSTGKIYSSQEVLLKYDISDFYGIGENNKAILKIKVVSVELDEYSSKGGKIKILTVKDEDYSKDMEYQHDESLAEVSNNTLTKTAQGSSENIFNDFTFDVTKIVNDKIAKGENSVTFVIQLYNDEVRDKAYVSLQKEYGPKLTIE